MCESNLGSLKNIWLNIYKIETLNSTCPLSSNLMFNLIIVHSHDKMEKFHFDFKIEYGLGTGACILLTVKFRFLLFSCHNEENNFCFRGFFKKKEKEGNMSLLLMQSYFMNVKFFAVGLKNAVLIFSSKKKIN